MNKLLLRKVYTEKRKALTPVQVDDLSRAITERFPASVLEGAKYLHLFYPIQKKAEFNSLHLASRLRLTHPEINLVLPKTNFNDHSLLHVVWQERDTLFINERGITEPSNGEIIPPQLLDIILVPLLAYDLHGNRVGYGKGFYDRFLAECRPEALKIGVSFFPPETQIDDADNLDIPIDLCVTPDKIWYLNNKTH